MPVTDTASETVQAKRGERDPSIVRIIRDLRDDTLSLVRQEVALAKREMALQAGKLGRNAAFLGAGGLIAVFGILFALLAVSNLLFAGLAKAGFSGAVANWLAPALLGMILLIVAASLALKSLRGMRRALPVPRKAWGALKEEKEWIKGRIR
jgi:hypothetical protein